MQFQYQSDRFMIALHVIQQLKLQKPIYAILTKKILIWRENQHNFALESHTIFEGNDLVVIRVLFLSFGHQRQWDRFLQIIQIEICFKYSGQSFEGKIFKLVGKIRTHPPGARHWFDNPFLMSYDIETSNQWRIWSINYILMISILIVSNNISIFHRFFSFYFKYFLSLGIHNF